MKYKEYMLVILVSLILSSCQTKEEIIEGAQVISGSLPQSSSVSQSESIPERSAPKLSIKFGSASADIEPYVTGQNEDNIPVITVTSQQAMPVIVTENAMVTVTLGNETVYKDDYDKLSGLLPQKNGIYRYSVSVGDINYKFNAEVKIEPSIKIDNTGTVLGETLVLYAHFAEGQEVTAETDLKNKPTFYSFNNSKMALLPVHYNTKPGVYKLNIKVGIKLFEYQITVDDREFDVQHLTVDQGTASETIESKQANEEWNKRIEPLKKIGDNSKYWQGSFMQPVQGKITTEFGSIRYVNDSKDASRHGGIDIAAQRGTPVVAANGGRIIFSDFLKLTGNTVVIEHGIGLKSWYYHMDSLSIKEGDMVKKGDVVGTVGSTGFSTGPHLHYALSVNNIFINPWTAFEKGIE